MTHSIPERLAQLRLHGLCRAFVEQASLNGFKEMSFDDRFALLLEREELERANRAVASRVGRARFKQPAAFEDVKPSATRGLDKTTVQNLGSCDWIRKKRNLILTGPSGCGKTFLATALSHRACLMGFTARYFRAPQLLAELEAAREDGRQRRFVTQLGRVHALIVDDFMLSAMTEAEQKDLFELVEERHEVTATIFTSQNPVSLWHGLMPNPAIADAVLDRISNVALRVELKGESHRRKRAQDLDQESLSQA